MAATFTVRPVGILNRVGLRLVAFAAMSRSPDELYEDLARDFRQEIERGFANEINPYQEPWPKSAAALAEGRQTLTDTRRLRDSWVARRDGANLYFDNLTPYAGTHQFGLRNQQQRLMVPTEARGLPALWRRQIEARVDQAWSRIWNRY